MVIGSAFGQFWGNCFGHTEIDQVDYYFRNYIWPRVCHGSHISQAMCLLKWQEVIYFLGTENEDSLLNHFMSLKNGLQFLEMFLNYSTNEDLKHRIEHLVANVKQRLHSSLTCIRKRKNLTIKLGLVYADLRREMSYVVVKPGTDACDALHPEINNITISYFIRTSDHLLENIRELINSNWKADQISLVMKELEDILKMLSSLKPLSTYIADVQYSLRSEEFKDVLITLIDSMDKAICRIYLSFVGNMDEEMVLVVKSMFTELIEKTNVRNIYLKTLTTDISRQVNVEKREPYILHNLIRLLRCNERYHNAVHFKLYWELYHIRTHIEGLEKFERLKHFHYFQESFEDILVQAVPILCLSSNGHIEEETNRELDGVLLDILDQIKCVKSESQEIKLSRYPRIDNTGFLKTFLRYLEELLKSPQISILENEINMLISLLKVTIQHKLHEGLSTHIIYLAYQAEYVIDLYLVESPSRYESSFFLTLSNIIELMKTTVEYMHGVSGKELPAPDVSRTSSPQVFTVASVQYIDNDVIVGIKEHVNVIKEYLLSGEDVLDAISVVGMAGIGKTTLALTIYNTPSVDQHFDIKVWCTVSQCYQVGDLLHKTLGQMNIDNKGDDQELADRLNKSLRQKRYLFILDDVWDTSVWNNLKWYLPNDRQGSRVLITTRDRSVALKTNNSKVHELGGLTQEESWELFQKKLPRGEGLPPDLLNIAKGMVVQCKGLPLSIVIVAGLFSDVRSKKKWNEIAENVTASVLTDPQGKCKAILELSYNHLPDHLRSCFLYLGVFPEDFEIPFTQLVWLWTAEGFVQDTESKNMEEVAEEYMEDLIGRSLIICTSERSQGGVKACRLHDLLRDFCLVKAQDGHFLSVVTNRYNSQPLRDPRRLSINTKGSGYMLNFHDLQFSFHSVRSILHFGHLEPSEIDERIESFDMSLLKVLDIGRLSTCPTSNISTLIHLRYLAIWRMQFWGSSALLSDITKLQNLEILVLRSEELLVEVPDSIWDLVKLRHVAISKYTLFRIDSKRLEKSAVLLEKLRSLSYPRLTSGDSKWLSKLPRLQKLFCIFVHSRDDSLNRCGFPVLQDNDQLLSLSVKNGLEESNSFQMRCNSCKLHLPTSLRKLTLSDFKFHSKDISDIARALPGLEILKLYHSQLVRVMRTWTVNEEDFPKLKVLKLKRVRFSHWIVASEDYFPGLEQLWIEDCNQLEEIPLVFGYVTNLSCFVVRGCKPSVDDSARKIEEIQRDEQNSVLKVRIIPGTLY